MEGLGGLLAAGEEGHRGRQGVPAPDRPSKAESEQEGYLDR